MGWNFVHVVYSSAKCAFFSREVMTGRLGFVPQVNPQGEFRSCSIVHYNNISAVMSVSLSLALTGEDRMSKAVYKVTGLPRPPADDRQ
jgi:hypothetical protein